MNFILPGANVKMLARTVNCFSKIGNELFFEATPDGLELKTINSTNTAYAVAQFKQDFFTSFQQGDKDTPDENCCKISVKPILKIFKNLSAIQTCKIWLEVGQSKIIFQFRCKSDVLKTHKIFLLESEHINSLKLSQNFPSEIVGSHKVFSNILLHLHHSVDEITFDLKEDKTIVSNFVDNDQSDRTTLRSALAIATTAFQSYQLEEKANLTFCYKEFKAITMFASFNRLNVQMSFSQPGMPLMLQMSKAGVVYLKVIMGTMQPAPSLHKRRMNRKNKNASANRSALMDSEAINTLLTEDISTNTETSQNVTTTSVPPLPVPDVEVAEERISQAASSRNANITVGSIAHKKINNADDCSVARSRRSELQAKSKSILDQQQQQNPSKQALTTEPSSETMFNTNTDNFVFLHEFNLPTANNTNINTLPSLPAVGTSTVLSANTDQVAEIVISDSENGSGEGGGRSNVSTIPRKRQVEIVPESPEAVEERRRKQAKLRHIFRRCFEPTFDPAMQPGCSQILAANSDSEEES